jgi:predicted ABC-class ATPase
MNCAKVRPLADAGPEGGNGGVSSILVLGGSGDYFEVADTVIAMDA